MTCFAQTNLNEYQIPQNLPTYFKSWMPYTAITDKTSEQWTLQQKAHTDDKGFRRIDEDYMVAMGSYYSDLCGGRFQITLDSEKTFTVIVGDIKADIHTDPLNMYHPVIYKGEEVAANVLEFIVDTDVMDNEVLLKGTICDLGFEGEIIKIEKLDVKGCD